MYKRKILYNLEMPNMKRLAETGQESSWFSISREGNAVLAREESLATRTPRRATSESHAGSRRAVRRVPPGQLAAAVSYETGQRRRREAWNVSACPQGERQTTQAF